MADLVSDSLTQRRFLLLVLGSFAGLALLLSAVGIYGVVSYTVARRTREIGIRMALGAAPASVRSLVLRRALRPVIYGLVVGVGGGLALAQTMSKMNATRTHRTGSLWVSHAPRRAPKTAVGARQAAIPRLSPRLSPISSSESVRFLRAAPTIEVRHITALVAAIACRSDR